MKKYLLWIKIGNGDWFTGGALYDSRDDAERTFKDMPNYVSQKTGRKRAEEWRNAKHKVVEVDVPMPDDSADAA